MCTCRKFQRACGQRLTPGHGQSWRSSKTLSQNSGAQRVQTCPNGGGALLPVPEKNGSSGRTRTYNPPVNRMEFVRQYNNFAAQMTTFGTIQNQRVTSGA